MDEQRPVGGVESHPPSMSLVQKLPYSLFLLALYAFCVVLTIAMFTGFSSGLAIGYGVVLAIINPLAAVILLVVLFVLPISVEAFSRKKVRKIYSMAVALLGVTASVCLYLWAGSWTS